MAVRFRELHGFTYGDPQTVQRADVGRGLDVYVWGVPPERRLPMLAYHAMLLAKNETADTGSEELDRICFGLRQSMGWLAEAIERKAVTAAHSH